MESHPHATTASSPVAQHSNITTASTKTNENNATYTYGQVLTKITELQQELEKTIRVATNLKNENAALRTNYNDSQNSLARTQKRLKEAQDCILLVKQTTTTDSLEQEALVECRAQLDQCTKELETAIQERNTAWTKTEGNIRSQLREELLLDTDSNHQKAQGSKVSLLEKEVEKWRQEYVQLRKENEQIKAKQQCDRNEISEREEALEAEISVLTSSFEKLVRSCSSQSSSEKPCKEMALLELQLKEKDTIIANIRSQLSNAKNERDQQELANVNLIARHQEDLLPKMKQVTLLEADKKILEQRCEGLQAELKKVKDANADIKEKIVVLNREHEASRLNETHRLEQEFESRRTELLEEASKEENMLANKVQNLEKQITLLKNEKIESQKTFISEKQLILDQHNRKFQNIEKQLENSEKTVLQLQQQVGEYQAHRVQFEREWKNKESEYVSAIGQQNHELELHRVNAERTRIENEAILRRMVAAEQKSSQLKSSLSPLQQDLAFQTESNDELKSQLQAAEQKIAEVEVARDTVRVDALRIQEELERWKKTYNEQKAVCRTTMGNLTAELYREKKLSKSYKEKAMDAHKKTRLAKQTLEQCYVPYSRN